MAQLEQQDSHAPTTTSIRPELTICLRDISAGMVKAWQDEFKGKKYENVKVSWKNTAVKHVLTNKTDQ